jgi:hypothetical protein
MTAYRFAPAGHCLTNPTPSRGSDPRCADGSLRRAAERGVNANR